MAKTPDEIVAEIDRKQNEEDLDLPARAGRMLKEKLDEDLTGWTTYLSIASVSALFSAAVLRSDISCGNSSLVAMI